MHRSSSASRVSEDDSMVTVTSSSSSSSLYSNFRAAVDGDLHLPTYDPLSQVGQRERSRLRSAHHAIHAIPLLLLLCAIILWFFSTPPPPKLEFSFYFPSPLIPILFLFCVDLTFRQITESDGLMDLHPSVTSHEAYLAMDYGVQNRMTLSILISKIRGKKEDEMKHVMISSDAS
ncbi:uncharacterized protein G2W53_019633 [Senna tora]|uniref:Uncharacterized protein n=1 Tax=Senna tora TaxID=362788 RepID=A0A834WS21_9FABA|nr:uncharacterized protein G2W53_019633 [Senna tora]